MNEEFNSACFFKDYNEINEFPKENTEYKEIIPFKNENNFKEENQKDLILKNMKSLNEELDNLLKRLKQKDIKLSWEIERLNEKESKLIEKIKPNLNHNDFFSFSLNFQENHKTIENRDFEKNQEEKKKFEILEEKECKIKFESSKLSMKEKEIEAKFQHMKKVYKDFLKIKTDFNKNSKKLPITVEKNSIKKLELSKTEKILIEKENAFNIKNLKLNDIIKKLDNFYNEFSAEQNEKIEESFNASLPSIHTFNTKKRNFKT